MINAIKNWFWRSETILWARAQMLVGVVWTVLSATDLSPVLDARWLTYWLIVNGVVTELLRRRGATGQSVVVPEFTRDASVAMVTKSFLASDPPVSSGPSSGPPS